MLNGIEFNVRGLDEEWCVNGRVDKKLCLGNGPSLKQPLETGLHWIIIRWQIEELCPTLMDAVQDSMNLQNIVARQNSKLQVLMNIHRRSMIAKPTTDKEWELASRRPK